MTWIDCGSYYLSTIPQGSTEWLTLRKGKITMSMIGAILGYSKFTSPEEAARIIKGELEVEITPAMKHGTLLEPEARRWYENKHQLTVTEIGLAISKDYPWLGASSDGLVDDCGCIEIKCPLQMYGPLTNFTPGTKGFNHIWPTHYAQMQGQMAILERQWCDYVVYCPTEKLVFEQRIPFNPAWWNSVLPRLIEFYQRYIN